MSRQDLIKHKFPTEYEDEVLQLLETYGSIADPGALADLMGVHKKAMQSFLSTNRAKEAMARAHPNAKELLRKHIQLPNETTQDQALPDSALIEGTHTILESEIPEGLDSVYSHIFKDKRKTDV